MEIVKTSIPDVVVIYPKVFNDSRGFFLETYQKERYAACGIQCDFVQDNHSASRQGTLRGLHYQIRQPQGKLVYALQGRIFDVAVDLREKSETFGQFTTVILNSEEKNQIWVPPGFAHGFYVLSEEAEIAYKASNYYAPEWERTLLWNDPSVKIDWPLVEGVELVISEKDKKGKTLVESEIFGEAFPVDI